MDKKQTNHKTGIPNSTSNVGNSRLNRQHQLAREFIARAQGAIDRYTGSLRQTASGSEVRNIIGRTATHNTSSLSSRTREERLPATATGVLHGIGRVSGNQAATGPLHREGTSGVQSVHRTAKVPSEDKVRAWLAGSVSRNQPSSSNPIKSGPSGTSRTHRNDTLHRIDAVCKKRVRVHLSNLEEISSKKYRLSSSGNFNFIPIKLNAPLTQCYPANVIDIEETSRGRHEPDTTSNQENVQEPDLLLPPLKDSGGAVKLAIVAESYPQETIVTENLLSIQSYVTEKLEDTPDPLPILTFSSGVVAGILYVSCNDSAAAQWLQATVNGVKIGDLKLKVLDSKDLPKPIKMAWRSRNSALTDNTRAIRMLQRLNPTLKTNTWKVVDKIIQGMNVRRVVLMDKISAEVIKVAGYVLPGGLEFCTFKLLEEDKEDIFTYWEEAEEPEEPLHETELEHEGQARKSDCGEEHENNKESSEKVSVQLSSGEKVSTGEIKIRTPSQINRDENIIDDKKNDDESENRAERECLTVIECDEVIENCVEKEIGPRENGDLKRKAEENESERRLQEETSDNETEHTEMVSTCEKNTDNVEESIAHKESGDATGGSKVTELMEDVTEDVPEQN